MIGKVSSSTMCGGESFEIINKCFETQNNLGGVKSKCT